MYFIETITKNGVLRHSFTSSDNASESCVALMEKLGNVVDCIYRRKDATAKVQMSPSQIAKKLMGGWVLLMSCPTFNILAFYETADKKTSHVVSEILDEIKK